MSGASFWRLVESVEIDGRTFKEGMLFLYKLPTGRGVVRVESIFQHRVSLETRIIGSEDGTDLFNVVSSNIIERVGT